MSDTYAAPAPSAPAAPQTAEVPINPNPTSLPAPIGSQAPSRMPDNFRGSEHRPDSRRETIAKAFERARTDPVPANRERPGMGHNQPPEATKKEKTPPPTEKLDLKKRPPAEPPERRRGEHGHFAANATAAGSAPAQSRQQAKTPALQAPQQRASQAPQPRPQQLPSHAPYAQPIARMSARAKADWHAAPESVRGDMHRMYREFDHHYRRMSADSKAMDAIRPYHQMAAQHGTTLDRALANYVGMENKLRSDPVAGLDVIVSNLNLRTPEGQKLTLRDLAWHVLNQSPDQHKLLQQQNTQAAISHQIGQLQQHQQAIAQGLQQLHYERAFGQTRSEVDRFAETHPRLDELGDQIQAELKLGFDLPTAYRRAELLKPATHAAQTRTTTAQTRTSDRSISGAPARGSNGAARPQRGSPTARAAVSKALSTVRGAL